MIELKNITKIYQTESKRVNALNDVSIAMRKSEFLCILGHSGSGKTTLLNIIGGLDKYTSGDLIIDGKSTVDFKDTDWDTYRNNKVGFVFQSYNLISHQTVLENVETALTISGISREQRRKMAIDVLVKVGLEEHLRKKPRQLSGGEMQRVAIARALVNNPDLILADEPTGALDSKNSILIMDLLKEISKDRLVVMVTHNDFLAETYATRIVKMSDGEIISDSNPYFEGEVNKFTDRVKKPSFMSYSLAMKLSFKNLLGKKVRTLLTSISSSIAILGVALILACSNGLNVFVNKVQREALASVPISVKAHDEDYTPIIQNMLGYVSPENVVAVDDVQVKTGVKITKSSKNTVTYTVRNNISEEFLNYIDKIDKNKVTFDAIKKTNKNVYKSTNLPMRLLSDVSKKVDFMVSSANSWYRLPDDNKSVLEQYDVISGKYPESAFELALVVDKNTAISDLWLLNYFMDINSFIDNLDEYSFNEFIKGDLGEFKLVLNDTFYTQDASGNVKPNKLKINDYVDKYYKIREYTSQIKSFDKEGMLDGIALDNLECYDIDPESIAIQSGVKTLKIVGILRLKNDTQFGLLTSPICYTSALDEYILNDIENAEIKEGNIDKPTVIHFYPTKAEYKQYLKDYLDAFNLTASEENKIRYTDNAGIVFDLVKMIVNIVITVLIILTSISIVVACIMVGIITYVSVIERTKEIGILRAMGARKKDVIRLFITETGIIGLLAGITGLIITAIATLPLNAFLRSIIGVSGFAFIKVWQIFAILIVAILLTVVAGLIPSTIAGKKDPVKALRSDN